MATSVDAGHDDMMHDAQFDYYSKRLATCSSDRLIKIFSVGPDNAQTHKADLVGHEGPVWQVAWAHPKFGSLLASCSYDRKVIIWKESPADTWNKIYTFTDHDSSVNGIAWAPHEYGLVLASASSDGSISFLSHKSDDSWVATKIHAHQVGANSVAWAPATPDVTGADGQVISGERRAVSGGCDSLIKIWKQNPADGSFACEETLEGHSDWVRAVAWAPSVGVPGSTIASGSQDGTVVIWSRENDQSGWSKKVLPSFGSVVYGVSWSPMGNILAVASGDNKVTLWKESLDGEWQNISSITEDGRQEGIGQ
eukprot:TRINITY_DN1829_c1_g1_i1.p1 TRINITY_DN1829_c1_g1~~TRINITY_DN1829_c1_g1_i1.p1  ORF type:complete len:310 (+),score=64.82 TRINITY_DN1829_c1_g1_i1:384-1313(+)